MDGLTNFLANNYIWFLIITLIMLFALIGYLVDLKDIKSGRVKNTKDDELKIIDFSTVDANKSLNQSIKDEATNSLNLDEYAKKQKGDDFISADKLQNMNFDTTTPLADSNNIVGSVLNDESNDSSVNEDVNLSLENDEVVNEEADSKKDDIKEDKKKKKEKK